MDIYKAKADLQDLSLDGDFPGEEGDSGLTVFNLGCYWNYLRALEYADAQVLLARDSNLINLSVAWGTEGFQNMCR